MQDKEYKVSETAVALGEMSQRELRDFARKYADRLLRKDHNIGIWYDKTDGNVYLDVSVVKSSREEAL